MCSRHQLLALLLALVGVASVAAEAVQGGLVGKVLRKVTGNSDKDERDDAMERLETNLARIANMFIGDEGAPYKFMDFEKIPSKVYSSLFGKEKTEEYEKATASRVVEADPYNSKIIGRVFPADKDSEKLGYKLRLAVPDPFVILGGLSRARMVNWHLVENKDTGETWVEVHPSKDTAKNFIRRWATRLIPVEIDSPLGDLRPPVVRDISPEEARRRYGPGTRERESMLEPLDSKDEKSLEFLELEELAGNGDGNDDEKVALLRQLAKGEV